jgi:CHAT domain-containing protein
MGMRMLIVAPDLGLATLQELLEAMSGRQPVVLAGTVPGREVLAQIASGGYEGLHFATHGGRQALMASDGLIEEELLVQAVAAASTVRLAVLNACHSVHTAALLHRSGVAHALAWRQEVADRAASAWAVAFYRHLGLGGDVEGAYQAATEVLQRRYPEEEVPLWISAGAARPALSGTQALWQAARWLLEG